MSNLRKYQNPFSASRNDNNSQVAHSGNSDVDVIVEVNTMPIAYAMLCSLYATNQLSLTEFEDAIKNLKSLVEEDRLTNDNDPNTAKIYHIE
ncbi:hypothetical protein [Terribacillus saccharophilus]|uniref:DUF3231 domain-containing protein n=1 Tax=Terribacillus saccharophilus TaxID=361277 RepID=A0AAX2EF30_9BACI|nr:MULTISPECIES: hypothetical protein [Terribacillus]MCM3226439.1 hypothetical protein [Terribacillus saccharophilus]MEC0282258.1 hypothetical protein [Terribacillus saccharophilus]MEC0288983.1 hypothetical protein [Terribacillus saccharophilus]MEC0302101.1 hypothetical protein [Terribacillus saccharophilus]SEN21226.1 hypothetical protein SAMN04489762_1706 [Terribacillus saccharophilus]